MERDESVVHAAGMWAFYMAGVMLLIGASVGTMVSILFLAGELGTGASGRVVGALGLLASIGAFLVGRNLTDAYRMYPKSGRRGREP